MEIIEGHML